MGKVGLARKKEYLAGSFRTHLDQLPRMGGSDANAVFLLPRPGELGGGEGNTPVWVMPHGMDAVALGWPGSQVSSQGPLHMHMTPGTAVWEKRQDLLGCQQWIRENRFHLFSNCSGQKSGNTLPPLSRFPTSTNRSRIRPLPPTASDSPGPLPATAAEVTPSWLCSFHSAPQAS